MPSLQALIKKLQKNVKRQARRLSKQNIARFCEMFHLVVDSGILEVDSEIIRLKVSIPFLLQKIYQLLQIILACLPKT